MKKFERNDVFYNTISGAPNYKIIFYNGNVSVNDQISEGVNKLSASINLFEYTSSFTASLGEGFLKKAYAFDGSYEISGTLSYNPRIKRNLIYKPSTNFSQAYTSYSTIKKISALRNYFSKYFLDNSSSIFSNFLNNDGTPQNLPQANTVYTPNSNPTYFIQPAKSINLIEIPQAFYGIKIEPGSLNLKVYITGTLVAEAADLYKNSRIIQTTSSYNSSLVGTEIGMIMYDEGILLLTGSSNLAATTEPYVQPVSGYLSTVSITENLKWIHFGSHSGSSTTTITPIASASFELNFKGSTQINTLTMFCTAEKNNLTWSNNRTFLSGGQVDTLALGQTNSITINSTQYTGSSSSVFIPANGQYFENDQVLVKNTISSSFANYNAPYNPQVFISEIALYNEDGDMIAIAKLANPVRKTKDMDYTFKLKLDM